MTDLSDTAVCAHQTLEQRIKTAYGLTIGTHLVLFTVDKHSRLALVRISEFGKVHYFLQPGPGDMYSSWSCILGDDTRGIEGDVIVWGASDPQLMKCYDGEPVAIIPLKTCDSLGKVLVMDREDALPYVSLGVDDAGAVYENPSVPEHARLVGWKLDVGPLFVAAWSYLPDIRLSDEDAKEIAIDLLRERKWFADRAHTEPDYVL